MGCDFIDASIVNVVLPAMREGLDFSVQSLQWVPSGHLLTYGGFMLLGGRAADLLGRRRVLVAGTVVFAVSSAVGGLAGSAGVLLTDGPGWRWVMLVNPPICVLVLIGIYLLVEGDRKAVRLANFDFLGTILATGGMLLLVFTLVKAPDVGWDATRTIAAANAGVPADKAGLAAALLNASQQIGGALGLAIFSAVAAARTEDLLAARTPVSRRSHDAGGKTR